MLNSMLKIFVGPVMGGFEPPPTPLRQYATDNKFLEKGRTTERIIANYPLYVQSNHV
jgi:hypothetical protein